MLPSLDNFVSFGSEVIKARPHYQQMLLDIYSTSITNDQLGENDKINGSKLAESMLLNLRGSLDNVRPILYRSRHKTHHTDCNSAQALQGIVNITLGVFDTAQGSALKLANLEVLINTVLYNPVAALHFMENYRQGMARTFFDKWFAAINAENKLPRVHDKKLTIVALCALLELSPENIPVSLRDGWPGIVAGIVQTFKDLPKAIEGGYLHVRCLRQSLMFRGCSEEGFGTGVAGGRGE